MIRIQIIGQRNARIQPLIREAIKSGKLRTFRVSKVKRGLKIRHKTYLGSITFATTRSILNATLRSRGADQESLLLGAFVGRLADHFKDSISAVNIQFQ